MKSNELAALAGVTPRTLRHYHQVGVLPEPERRPNGYRQYTMQDLIRLLRIKRLAALGMPLERMVAVLESDDADHQDLLTELESALDAQIARLVEQKALLSFIREHRVAPDLPPNLARIHHFFSGNDTSPAMRRMDREQSILLAHFIDDAKVDQLAESIERLMTSDDAALIIGLTQRFDELNDSTHQSLLDRLIDDIHAAMRKIDPSSNGSDVISQELLTFLQQHLGTALNSAQLTAITRILERAGVVDQLPGTAESPKSDFLCHDRHETARTTGDGNPIIRRNMFESLR